MLKALSTVEAGRADAALAAAVLAIGNSRLEPVPAEYRELVAAVIDEARDRLSIIKEEGLSDREASRIRAFLSDEIKRRIEEGQDVNLLERRLGDEGKLPLGGYHLAVSDSFKRNFAKESVKFVLECVRQSDRQEHLFSPETDRPSEVLSLFLKQIKSRGSKTPQWALIVATRKASEITVQEFWRIFPEVVSLSGEARPIPYLEQFLRIYGEPLFVDGTAVGPMVHNRAFDSPPPGPFITFKPGDHDVVMSVMWGGTRAAPRILLAFGVNTGRYFGDLKKFA